VGGPSPPPTPGPGRQAEGQLQAALRKIRRVADGPLGQIGDQIGDLHIVAVAANDPDATASLAGGEFVLVPRFDVYAAAGDGIRAEASDQKPPLAFLSAWIKRRASGEAQCRLIAVTGDSMDPLLRSGDIILVDHGQRQVRNGDIYVFRHEDCLLVKRLAFSADGARLRIISANAETHPPYEVVHDDKAVEIYGRVIWSARDW
jgi:phage repressor protein C with HTH and peptisase S24 domain